MLLTLGSCRGMNSEDWLDKTTATTQCDKRHRNLIFALPPVSGDAERAASVYKGYDNLLAQDVADNVVYCATRCAVLPCILTFSASGSVQDAKAFFSYNFLIQFAVCCCCILFCQSTTGDRLPSTLAFIESWCFLLNPDSEKGL